MKNEDTPFLTSGLLSLQLCFKVSGLFKSLTEINNIGVNFHEGFANSKDSITAYNDILYLRTL